MMNSKIMNITVSIVEDDGPTREILVDWVTQAEGFKCVSQHGSVEHALKHLPAERPSVVLMDINLPGLSGIDGVRRLKPLLPGAQYLMLTVYEDADHVFDALAAGATGYLLKQTPRGELLTAIREVHAGGSPMTSNIARRVVQAFQPEDDGTPPSANLSQREREVLELLAHGYQYKEIVDKLNVSRGSVNTYIRRIYEKLHVRSRWQAVAKFSHFSLREDSHRPSRD
jgi:DNA-binding NarL/FixJ family response regulator